MWECWLGVGGGWPNQTVNRHLLSGLGMAVRIGLGARISTCTIFGKSVGGGWPNQTVNRHLLSGLGMAVRIELGARISTCTIFGKSVVNQCVNCQNVQIFGVCVQGTSIHLFRPLEKDLCPPNTVTYPPPPPPPT